VPAIIYHFKAIGGALRKQRLDDCWQPAKPEPEPKTAEPLFDQNEVWRRFVERLG